VASVNIASLGKLKFEQNQLASESGRGEVTRPNAGVQSGLQISQELEPIGLVRDKRTVALLRPDDLSDALLASSAL